MDFEPCFKVYNLVSIPPKSMKLGQMINLNVIFHMGGVSLSIGYNSKLAPVPRLISEWPIGQFPLFQILLCSQNIDLENKAQTSPKLLIISLEKKVSLILRSRKDGDWYITKT